MEMRSTSPSGLCVDWNDAFDHQLFLRYASNTAAALLSGYASCFDALDVTALSHPSSHLQLPHRVQHMLPQCG